MIEIIVNGIKTSVPKELNVKELIEKLDYQAKAFAFALNGTFVTLASYEDTIINENDCIEILAPIQGG